MLDVMRVLPDQPAGALFQGVLGAAFAHARDAGVGFHRHHHVALVEKRIELGRRVDAHARDLHFGDGGPGWRQTGGAPGRGNRRGSEKGSSIHASVPLAVQDNMERMQTTALTRSQAEAPVRPNDLNSSRAWWDRHSACQTGAKHRQAPTQAWADAEGTPAESLRHGARGAAHTKRGRPLGPAPRVASEWPISRGRHSACPDFCHAILGIAAFLLATASSPAQPYTARQTEDHGIAIVRLSDAAHGVEVSIVPSIGNLAYEMKVHGHNILHFPYADVAEFARRPGLCAIPLLAPWANRMTEQGFWANGKKYAFNLGLGNVRGALPIHGLLVNSPLWHVTEVAADAHSARVTSRLEFWKDPDLMAQWPFAHEYEMTYSLAEGVLEVRLTVIEPQLASPCRWWWASIRTTAFPIFRATNGWRTFRRASEWWPTSGCIPTGEFKPMDLPSPLPLKGRTLDDGFIDLERDSSGRAHFSIEAAGRTVEAMFGPKYPVAVVWEPAFAGGPAHDFICFEPMTAITSGVNLAHEGKYGRCKPSPPAGAGPRASGCAPAGYKGTGCHRRESTVSRSLPTRPESVTGQSARLPSPHSAWSWRRSLPAAGREPRSAGSTSLRWRPGR